MTDDGPMTDGGRTGPIRVLVADDQAIVRDGLTTLLSLLPDVEVVATAADGAEAVEEAVRTRPDVVLMDLRMPRADGVEVTTRLRAGLPAAAVLVLTTYADDESILAALRAGARGYLTKDAGRAELAAAVRAAAAGQTVLAAEVGARVVDVATGVSSSPRDARVAEDAAVLRGRFPVLTAREAEVLALIGAGRTNPAIADELFVSVVTVKSHVNAIFAKLHLTSRAEAIVLLAGPR